jgi:hypothetical protein
LPLRYKLMCSIGVLPLFTATIALPVVCSGVWKGLGGAAFPIALVAFAVVEGACVRWYRKNGFLSGASSNTSLERTRER